ncbi:unnamed protein product [Plutella xylostella]|uniref:(diamondback moth) hypothetical protein n=1 Tax=Plutella xylostella TaxID=51655 RepID=A0A8S4FX01_PLUXY|nr:unnamed protein product [Plutella xylostella]
MSFDCLLLVLCTVFSVLRATDVNVNVKFQPIQHEDSNDVITPEARQPIQLEDSDDVITPETRRNMERPIGRIRDTHPMKFLDPPKDKNKQVLNTKLSSTANFPYMALILIHDRPWCAGAIVDVNWIVTAAHCLNYVLPMSPTKHLGEAVKARVGSASAADGGHLVEVAGAVRHPRFEEEPVPHADVALLKLDANLEFSNYVDLIKIYDGTREPFAQSFVAVTGWGAVKGSGASFKDPPGGLATTRLKVRSQQFCADAYQLVHGFRFTKDLFCASMRQGARDACLFDAGAPAVQKNQLMGIMSFGPEQCGDEYQPAVFIKAFYFRDFVKETIASFKTTADLLAAMQDVEKQYETGPPPDQEENKNDDSLTTTTEHDMLFH